jgi:Uma2 family endonuclease
MKRGSVEEYARTAPSERSNGRPTWEIALLYPRQGEWSVEEYLDLPTNRLIEYVDGRLEFLPMPTTLHQWIVFYLCRLVHDFVSSYHLGLILPAGLPVQLRSDKLREPDVVFMLNKHRHRMGEQFWKGADLVMEVVSDDRKSRYRDLVTKRKEYARARIPEYWIVDPKKKQITVLRLKAKKYAVHGTFKEGQTASSHLLPGFTVDVAAAFAGP